MQTLNRINPLQRAIAALRENGESIAFVPTMGALHDGHLALVRTARAQADHVVASIFVNPTQFGENEDFDAYPRQIDRDAARLAEAGVAILWAPTIEEMYPRGFATTVKVSGLSDGLCGAMRPNHFDGVATVVCKLFNQVRPDVAVFGEKDWQQLTIIRRMARDLDLCTPRADAIIGVPIVREADGLAMSSRNAYLTPRERAAAAALPRQMRSAIAAIEEGAPVAASLKGLEIALLEAGFASVDYVELADAHDLTSLTSLSGKPARLLVAARIGKARLIDNMPVG